jgi:hypothetical protein
MMYKPVSSIRGKQFVVSSDLMLCMRLVLQMESIV